MRKSNSEIKKTYKFNYKGFLITIERNFRNDNFLKFIKDENVKDYDSFIIPPRSYFMTLKEAKNYAIKLINIQ